MQWSSSEIVTKTSSLIACCHPHFLMNCLPQTQLLAKIDAEMIFHNEAEIKLQQNVVCVEREWEGNPFLTENATLWVITSFCQGPFFALLSSSSMTCRGLLRNSNPPISRDCLRLHENPQLRTRTEKGSPLVKKPCKVRRCWERGLHRSLLAPDRVGQKTGRAVSVQEVLNLLLLFTRHREVLIFGSSNVRNSSSPSQ